MSKAGCIHTATHRLSAARGDSLVARSRDRLSVRHAHSAIVRNSAPGVEDGQLLEERRIQVDG